MPQDVVTNGSTPEPKPLEGKGLEQIQKLLSIESPHIRVVEEKFHFKASKETIKGPDGKVIEEKEIKREPLLLTFPIPTFDGVIEALGQEKEREFILDLLKEAVVAAVREQINDGDMSFNQKQLDLGRLTINFLANQPPAARRGGGIAKETWELFQQDYLEVMPGVTGKSLDNCTNAVKLMVQRLQPVKTNKDIIKLLKDRLSTWFTHSPRAEELGEVFAFLDKKADEFLSADTAALLENL